MGYLYGEDEVDMLEKPNRHYAKKKYDTMKQFAQPPPLFIQNEALPYDDPASCSTGSGLCLFGQEMDWLKPQYSYANDTNFVSTGCSSCPDKHITGNHLGQRSWQHMRPDISKINLRTDAIRNRNFARDNRPDGVWTVHGFMRYRLADQQIDTDLQYKLRQIAMYNQ